MKTTNMVHKVYFENKALKLVVSIRLNDECKNGHADFAITAMGYEKNRFGRWVDSFGGCCHEEILKRFPELKPFVDLHLCDSNGFPLYTVENGFYHLWDESKTPNQRKKIVKEYLRINDAEFNKLVKVKDKAYFHYMLEALDLPKRWKKEAKEAIKMLEKLTRQKWDNSYKWERGNYKPQSQAEKEEVKERLASGYYSPKRIKNREEQQRQERIKKQILEIKKDLRAEKKKHTTEANLKIWLIQKIETVRKKDRKKDFLMSFKNTIYYNHTNELCFNWLSYEPQATKESFRAFCNAITESDFHKLPKGIKFVLKEHDKEVLTFSK